MCWHCRDELRTGDGADEAAREDRRNLAAVKVHRTTSLLAPPRRQDAQRQVVARAAQPASDAVDESAAIAERSVDVHDQALEVEVHGPGERDVQHPRTSMTGQCGGWATWSAVEPSKRRLRPRVTRSGRCCLSARARR